MDEKETTNNVVLRMYKHVTKDRTMNDISLDDVRIVHWIQSLEEMKKIPMLRDDNSNS